MPGTSPAFPRNVSRICFIEDFDPGFSPADGDLIISTTPRSSFALEQKGLAYFIPENFYSEKDLRKNEEDYFFEQKTWLKRFDEFLKENFEECKKYDLNLASMHYNRFKYLMDSVIIRFRILSSILSQVKTHSILFLRKETGEEGPPSLYNFDRKDRASYLEILELLLKEKFPQVNLQKLVPNTALRQGLACHSRMRLGGNDMRENFKKFYNFFRYRKYKKFASGADLKHLNVLFLDSGTEAMDMIIREFMARGAEVFIKNEKEMIHASSLASPSVDWHSQNGKPEDFALKAACQRAYEKWKASNLMDWIHQNASFDTTSVLEPYFQFFITKTVFEVLRDFNALRSFYAERRINLVIARGSAGKNYPAPLLAAEAARIPRVCFQHGVDPTDTKDWVVDELEFFDLNFAMHPASRDYFSAQSGEGCTNPCEVLESSHWLQHVRKKYGRKSAAIKTARGKIFYLPAKLAKGMTKFHGVIYPMTWYFEHQKALLEFFSSRGDFDFVYKHSNQQKWVEESLFPWLEQKRFPNVRVESGSFYSYMKAMDRVIFDRPSTGFFEAAAAGIPALCLYHETIKIWPLMQEIFGKALQSFSTTEEAVEKIRIFLDAKPSDYRVELPLSDFDAVDYLNQFNLSVVGAIHELPLQNNMKPQ